jgi:hypothetical protein
VPGVRVRVSLSRVQAIVGTLARVVTIGGAVLSVSPLAQAFTAGELIVMTQNAASHRPVTDATIEVLTAQNHLVATLKPDPTGRAIQDLKEGPYIVRVSHPRYAADVHRVQVMPRQTVEVRAALRAGVSSPLDRAVNDGVRAVKKALHF